MSALPLKADMRIATDYVCFGPKADISNFIRSPVSCHKQGWRNRETERLCSLQVDDRFKVNWRLHWQIGWRSAFQYTIDIHGRAAKQFTDFDA